MGGGERRLRARARARRSPLRQPRAARAARSVPRPARRTSSRRTGPSSSTRCAGTRSSRPGAARCSTGAAATIVGSEHIRNVVARGLRDGRPRPRDPARGRHRAVAARSARTQALERLLAEARLDPPNPGNANERLPDEGNPARLAEFLAGDRPTVVYYGKLIENKGVQVLLEALRGLGCASGDRRLRRLPRGARGAGGGSRRSSSRPARAPAPRTPAGARRRGRRALDLPRGVRDGRRRGRRRGLPADRREPLRARRDRARAGGGLSTGSRRARELPERRRRPPLRERLAAVLALRGDERAALRAAARRAAVERWSWTSVARRILAVAQ